MLAPARGLRWKECMACCGPTLQIGAIHLSNPCQHHNELREKKKREIWKKFPSVFGTGNSFNHEYKSRINETGTDEKEMPLKPSTHIDTNNSNSI